MSEDNRFTITIRHLRDFEFNVRFDWAAVPELLTDEPEPLGKESGPNASRLLAAAVGNCLTASLLFCAQKSRVPLEGTETTVTTTLTRNDAGRLRIGGLDVRIAIDPPGDQPDRVQRCLGLFEDYCVVTEGVRRGIPVRAEVVDADGESLMRSD